MRSEDRVFFESRAAFRAWLTANHDQAPALEVGIYKTGSGRPSVTYVEAVEEALCFGWIDGVRHAVDDVSFGQRFTPRRPGSNWSAVNIRRMESLIERGLVHAAGLRAFEARDPSAATSADRMRGLPESYLARLQAASAAWAYFSGQPPWYQRICAGWVMDAKREETRERRLETLIADSEAGRWIKLLERAKPR
jgi:uncharacterized protein YdeI (YjbR/CyaY-like superfamily)